MDEKKIQEQLDELKKNLEKTANESAKKEITAQIDALTKQLEAKIPDTKKLETSIDEVKKSVEEIKQASVKLDEVTKANQPLIDNIASLTKQMKENSQRSNIVTFGDAIHKAISEKKDELKNYTKNRTAIHVPISGFNVKTVGNMADANTTVSGTQGFITPSVLPGVGRKPYEVTHIRNICTVIPRNEGDTLPIVRDTGGEGAPTSVAKGAAKPQSDRDYVKYIVPITKIAHHYRIPEEMLEDIDWLASEITAVGVEELMALEDTMILTNSAGGEFQGLNQTLNNTAFSAPTGLAGEINEANKYDVLVAALTQLRILKGNANWILLNPADYAQMILSKSTSDDHYLFGAPGITVPNVWGVPLLPHTAVTQDKFFVGDFSQVVVAQRAGVSVRFYDQDQDNAIKNLITVVIEERLAAVARRADKIIYGDLTDAEAELENNSI